MTEEVSFYRDARKSYMVIRCPEGAAGEGYQYRMLAANHIDGLLDCSLRNIDADSYLYYDITSRQRLSALYTSRKMSARDVRSVLRDIAKVSQALADFLLDSSRILADPAFIFCDLRDGSCAFTYYPEGTDEGGILPLLEFMEKHVDEEDREASSVIYRMLSLAGNGDFCLTAEVLESVLGAENTGREEKENTVYEPPKPDMEIPVTPHAETVQQAEDQKKSRNSHFGSTVLYRLAAVVCVSAGIVLYGVCDLYPEWILSEAETMLCRAGMVVFPLLGVAILLIGRIRRKRENGDGTGADRDMLSKADSVQQTSIFPAEYPDAFQMKTEERNPDERCYFDPSQEQTVVLRREDSGRGKLYGTGKALGMQISLDQLPCTIGKMREYAGIVLNDSSVSRIHACVSVGEDGQLYIRDLNSTNGTIINGVGLRPEESAVIRCGDEIRFGALSFVYR